jgi:hypothetical protein
MADDRELARRALDLQARGRDYSLTQIPGYMAWSERKLKEGGNEALIAHLDATSMWLRPEDVQSVDEATFEDMLEDLRVGLAKAEGRQ